jgi:hypothetical protein
MYNLAIRACDMKIEHSNQFLNYLLARSGHGAINQHLHMRGTGLGQSIQIISTL